MNKLLLLISILISASNLFGQNLPDKMESTVLITDRSLYIAGEPVHFSVQLIPPLQNETHSKVLYIELISMNGEQIHGSKILLDELKYSGSIQIPENAGTGYYYLRAYTKFMRNYGPGCYGYCQLKIINPEKPDILNRHDSNGNGSNQDLRFLPDSSDFFEINSNADTFKVRQEVKITLKRRRLSSDFHLNTIVSVTPASTQRKEKLTSGNISDHSAKVQKYLPEVDGLTISGIVKDKITQQKVPFCSVNITILGQFKNLFYPLLTDSSGFFQLDLPELYGNRDIFISVENDRIEPDLLIDNDFCTQPAGLPSPAFKLTEPEAAAALQLAKNHTIHQHFYQGDDSDEPLDDFYSALDTIPFYGKATSITYINDFIDMHFLADYFSELPVPVRIRKTSEGSRLYITGNQAELSILPPLVMVDYVAVYDMDELLKIKPEKIYRIDVVPYAYKRGDITYGGILNLISLQNDFAGIILPENGIFLNYKFLSHPCYTSTIPREIPINFPDPGNILYWNPSINLNGQDPFQISFKTADTDGIWWIRATGITDKGETMTTWKKIVISSD